MRIQSMFQDDINRKINGVVKVDQDESSVLVQELNEYVITRELKKHFITFFNNYIESFNEETADIGVWISGFFGSGKSHFLKMLSYLLENKEVQGVKTVERFRAKFADDPATFMLIDRATRGLTHTILFNIDIEGPINKDKTAVLRVFAKMFYNYLGFYGENLKVAKLEQFIAKQGQTEEFRRVFEEKNGASWLESRDAYAFFEDDIVAALQEVLGMSEQAAGNWFNGTETVETSIAQLVSEIKEYVDSQPKDFRLLFMIDEVGQYVGGDTDLLINLQSLVEKIGSECGGKVWVVCTGQEAIDEIIKARENEFSRIQARFKTRLSLSSSSADEVIQKRILLKTDEAEHGLEQVYAANDSVLRNLFSFTDAILDIKGYNGAGEFAKNFPFVPYQFILMQKVFAEIRKHGNSGKHLSGGERSMLSGFQEAAQKIEDKDEYALAPFYLFYDTVHTFLDSSIRRVIERCERAAIDGNGIEQQDVDVLKLLYLVRYVDDVKANLDNIVILMADDIRLDKITMREQVRGSLDRLMSQNYIGRTGDTYNFLTDEEQDIQREIKNTPVATADIVGRIAQMIFADIYTTKKFNYGKYNFAFDVLLQKMLVKYAFNDSRSRKYDLSFFDRSVIDWLLNEGDSNPKSNITLMAGLAVNTSPAPDFVFGNNKLRWGKSPLLLSNSIVMNLDYETGKITVRDHFEPESFKKLALSYLFRFNSLQVIMMCWESTISAEDLKSNTVVLEVQYPYEILNQNGKSQLKRCTSETTYHLENLIDVSWGQGLMDEISYMRGTFSEKSQQYFKEVEQAWKKEEEKLAQEHPR